jgi:hypothetical protein
MDIGPRQAAFIKSEMKKIEEKESRQPTAKVEAERIREQAERFLTE